MRIKSIHIELEDEDNDSEDGEFSGFGTIGLDTEGPPHTHRALFKPQPEWWLSAPQSAKISWLLARLNEFISHGHWSDTWPLTKGDD